MMTLLDVAAILGLIALMLTLTMFLASGIIILLLNLFKKEEDTSGESIQSPTDP